MVSGFLAFQVVSAAPFGADEVVRLTNADRAAFGLPPLSVSETLTKAAEQKAAHMERYGYFAHTAPDGTRPWYFFEQSGYQYRYAGENLAIHFSTAEAQSSAWMASETHRENILSPKYVETGVAVRDAVLDGKHATISVELFGTRLGQDIPVSSPNFVSVAASAPKSVVFSGVADTRGEERIASEPRIPSQTENVSPTPSVSVSENGSLRFISEDSLSDPASVSVLLFALLLQGFALAVFSLVGVRQFRVFRKTA